MPASAATTRHAATAVPAREGEDAVPVRRVSDELSMIPSPARGLSDKGRTCQEQEPMPAAGRAGCQRRNTMETRRLTMAAADTDADEECPTDCCVCCCCDTDEECGMDE